MQYECILNQNIKYTHITPVRKTISCLSSITLFSRQSYWCISSYKVVILNTLNLSLNPDIVCTKLAGINLMGFSLRFHTLHQYTFPKSIWSQLWYDAPRIWNDLPDEVCSVKYLSSFRKKLKAYLFGKAHPP